MRGSGQVVKVYFSTSEDLFGVALATAKNWAFFC